MKRLTPGGGDAAGIFRIKSRGSDSESRRPTQRLKIPGNKNLILINDALAEKHLREFSLTEVENLSGEMIEFLSLFPFSAITLFFSRLNEHIEGDTNGAGKYHTFAEEFLSLERTQQTVFSESFWELALNDPKTTSFILTMTTRSLPPISETRLRSLLKIKEYSNENKMRFMSSCSGTMSLTTCIVIANEIADFQVSKRVFEPHVNEGSGFGSMRLFFVLRDIKKQEEIFLFLLISILKTSVDEVSYGVSYVDIKRFTRRQIWDAFHPSVMLEFLNLLKQSSDTRAPKIKTKFLKFLVNVKFTCAFGYRDYGQHRWSQLFRRNSRFNVVESQDCRAEINIILGEVLLTVVDKKSSALSIREAKDFEIYLSVESDNAASTAISFSYLCEYCKTMYMNHDDRAFLIKLINTFPRYLVFLYRATKKGVDNTNAASLLVFDASVISKVQAVLQFIEKDHESLFKGNGAVNSVNETIVSIFFLYHSLNILSIHFEAPDYRFQTEVIEGFLEALSNEKIGALKAQLVRKIQNVGDPFNRSASVLDLIDKSMDHKKNSSAQPGCGAGGIELEVFK